MLLVHKRTHVGHSSLLDPLPTRDCASCPPILSRGSGDPAAQYNIDYGRLGVILTKLMMIRSFFLDAFDA
jgi:hypothetical protein